jgi:hypothetical protein
MIYSISIDYDGKATMDIEIDHSEMSLAEVMLGIEHGLFREGYRFTDNKFNAKYKVRKIRDSEKLSLCQRGPDGVYSPIVAVFDERKFRLVIEPAYRVGDVVRNLRTGVLYLVREVRSNATESEYVCIDSDDLNNGEDWCFKESELVLVTKFENRKDIKAKNYYEKSATSTARLRIISEAAKQGKSISKTCYDYGSSFDISQLF